MEEYPNVVFYREAVAAAYLGSGELQLLLGRPEEAAAELTKSLAVSRELLDKFGILSASMLVRGQTFLAPGAGPGRGREAGRGGGAVGQGGEGVRAGAQGGPRQLPPPPRARRSGAGVQAAREVT